MTMPASTVTKPHIFLCFPAGEFEAAVQKSLGLSSHEIATLAAGLQNHAGLVAYANLSRTLIRRVQTGTRLRPNTASPALGSRSASVAVSASFVPTTQQVSHIAPDASLWQPSDAALQPPQPSLALVPDAASDVPTPCANWPREEGPQHPMRRPAATINAIEGHPVGESRTYFPYKAHALWFGGNTDNQPAEKAVAAAAYKPSVDTAYSITGRAPFLGDGGELSSTYHEASMARSGSATADSTPLPYERPLCPVSATNPGSDGSASQLLAAQASGASLGKTLKGRLHSRPASAVASAVSRPNSARPVSAAANRPPASFTASLAQHKGLGSVRLERALLRDEISTVRNLS